MNQQTPYDDSQADPERLAELDRRVVWHAFTQMADYEPLIIEQADGCELIDIDGNRYLDGVSSLWCTVHGHNHAAINAKGYQISQFDLPISSEGQLTISDPEDETRQRRIGIIRAHLEEDAGTG